MWLGVCGCVCLVVRLRACLVCSRICFVSVLVLPSVVYASVCLCVWSARLFIWLVVFSVVRAWVGLCDCFVARLID